MDIVNLAFAFVLFALGLLTLAAVAFVVVMIVDKVRDILRYG